MTVYLWVLSALAAGSILLCGWGWATGGPGTAKRSLRVPEHAPGARTRVHTPLGTVAEWPWGQRPARIMLAPDGVLRNTGDDPEVWMRRMYAEIDAGWFGR